MKIHAKAQRVRAGFLAALALCLSAIILSPPLQAQTKNDDFVKSKRERFNSQIKYKKMSPREQHRRFSRDIQQRHRDFSSLINKKWQDFHLKAGLKNPYRRQPKPRRIKPLAKPRDVEAKNLPTPPPPTLPQPHRPRLKPAPPQPRAETIKINAWGAKAIFHVPRSLITSAPQNSAITEDHIRSYWQRAQNETRILMQQARQVKTELKLNDWGYILLLHKITSAIFPDQEAARRILLWQIARMTQINLRLALAQGQVFLMFAARQTIFDTPRIIIDGTAFYILALPDEQALAEGQRLKTYPGDNRKALAYPVNLKMRRAPLIWEAGKSRQLAFDFGGRRFQLEVPVNRAMLEYMRDFPLADFAVFVDAPLSQQTEAALKEQLEPIISQLAAKSKSEAVNFLLRLVQTSFVYQNDQDRIGREDYLFGEETLSAKTSDCEDRVALFVWLATHLLGVKTVAIFWPGHLAAAVQIDGISGRSIVYRGQRYVYADPTFINANIGRAVPDFEAKKPARVIAIGG